MPHEGDSQLTPEMNAALAAHRLFTPAMRAKFAEALLSKVQYLWDQLATADSVPGLVVCQGLFKEEQRRYLSDRLPHARWIWTRASDETIRRRLAGRAQHAASARYAEWVNAGFESPTLAHDLLDNEGDRADLVRQLEALVQRT